MKKVLSVLLSLLLVFSCVSVAAAAEEKVTPLIIVPGYSASELYLDYGLETEEHVWGVQAKPIIDKVLERLGALGISLGMLGVNNGKVSVYFSMQAAIQSGSFTAFLQTTMTEQASTMLPQPSPTPQPQQQSILLTNTERIPECSTFRKSTATLPHR